MSNLPRDARLHTSRGGGFEPQLTLVGAFCLSGLYGRKIAVPTKKNRALLAVLALSAGQRVTRERLCGLLWSERADEQARSSLRQSLAVLRKEIELLEADLLQTRDDQISLLPFPIDAVEVLSASQTDDYDRLLSATLLMDGELLEDTAIREEPFCDWLEAERRRLFNAKTVILDKLTAIASNPLRVTHAQKLVDLDPLRDKSQRKLIEAYLAQDENGLAHQQFEQYRKLLAEQLGTAPSSEILLLLQKRLKPMADTATGVQQRQAKTEQREQLEPLDPNHQQPEDSPRLSIAVLPFASLNADGDQQLLADGISEDIITGLARFSQLSVVARNLSFRLRGEVDVIAASRSLNAAYIVEGSLRRAGDRVRVTVQLIAGETGKHAWAESYDTIGIQLFEAQDKVVNKIIGTLVGRIADAGARHARVKQPSSLAAYELVLRANAMNWESQESKAEARNLLQRAIEIDPVYATAHSLLAAVTLRQSAYHATLTRSVLDICLGHARTAIDIDPNDSACQSILGWVYIACGEFQLAAEHLDWSERLNPNNPFVLVNRGSLLNQTGHPQEAIACFERVKEIDPYFNPSWLQEKIGFAHFQARRYRESVLELERVSKKRFYISAVHAAAAALVNDTERMLAARSAALSLRPDCNAQIVAALLPCAKQEDRSHLVYGLEKAGFPMGSEN